jgi:sterol desaturase/sphingolipid hydroxylase (fatty acid hydroxylase superfamily)
METVELLTLLCLPAFLLLDLVHRAQEYRRPSWWRTRALVVSFLAFSGSIAIATGWGTLLAGVSLFDASGLGTWGGAALGVLVYELGHYAYHRAAHRFDRLWRWAHQFHHSAESLDAWGAFYMSPLDTLVFTTVSSLVFFPLLGVTLEAGVLGAAFLTFNAVFQHANIRTPRWLGYVIQRPESHSVHHGRNVHAHNYADLPLIDMLFGTFVNPREFRAEVGLEPGASARLGALLLGRDVSRPARAERREPFEAPHVGTSA